MLPLTGVRVVEFCNVAAGPFCGMLLADMGADVVKVEGPDGDMLRAWPPHTDGYSENFASLNRNKRSIALDLKDPADKAVAERLVLAADVVVENNRAGAMDRLGLGYAAFKERRPGLVYCSISAFGQTGPRADQGGFDLTVQAVSGIMSVTGEDGGAPVKCGVPLSDFSAGLYAAYSISAVLHRVRAGGPGEHLDVSMLGASLGIAALQTSEYFGSGRNPRKLGSAHPRNAPYAAFRARDGHIAIAAGNDKLWHSVCDTVGRADLKRDPRFLRTADRAANQEAIRAILEEAFADRSVAELIDALNAAGVPCGPINAYADVLADPQVAHMGWVQEIRLPSGHRTRTFGAPVRFGGAVPPVRLDPPALDGDRAAILADLARREAGRT